MEGCCAEFEQGGTFWLKSFLISISRCVIHDFFRLETLYHLACLRLLAVFYLYQQLETWAGYGTTTIDLDVCHGILRTLFDIDFLVS